MPFDRKKYFDNVRISLFGGSMNQDQVDGQEFILKTWEETREPQDLRFLAYELATTKHETASTMQPIEEYGKGAGQPYGKPDPETGQTYYGRGFVQLTWKDNYANMSSVVDYDLVNSPSKALDPEIAAKIMFVGMEEGMFRKNHYLERYFSASTDDPFNAREIINGDKNVMLSWTNGVSIGNLVKDYHNKFLKALNLSLIGGTPPIEAVTVKVVVPKGVVVMIEEI